MATGSSSNLKPLLERIDGKEFILTVSKKYSLSSDPHFNSFNPDYKGPLWKRTIKRIIGWKSSEADIDALIKALIIVNYKKSVEISETAGGAISIFVTHPKPTNASAYANLLMNELSLLVEN